MTYELLLHPDALDEWGDKPVRERKSSPNVCLTRMFPHQNSPARKTGYRLVYDVVDAQFIVTVVAVGKRERNAVYKAAVSR